jgi:hypothetical protein
MKEKTQYSKACLNASETNGLTSILKDYSRWSKSLIYSHTSWQNIRGCAFERIHRLMEQFS